MPMAKASSPTDNGKQKVRSAEVGTDILKALAELSPSTSLSRLAEHVQMPASKVHRYLQALIASGFAEQDAATNHYALGREALRVGLAALGSIDVLKVAAMPLSQLRQPFERYEASGEINTSVSDAQVVMTAVAEAYKAHPQDWVDGLTVDCGDWWFNLRPSNTEPLLRLNLEAATRPECDDHVVEVLSLVTSV